MKNRKWTNKQKLEVVLEGLKGRVTISACAAAIRSSKLHTTNERTISCFLELAFLTIYLQKQTLPSQFSFLGSLYICFFITS